MGRWVVQQVVGQQGVKIEDGAAVAREQGRARAVAIERKQRVGSAIAHQKN